MVEASELGALVPAVVDRVNGSTAVWVQRNDANRATDPAYHVGRTFARISGQAQTWCRKVFRGSWSDHLPEGAVPCGDCVEAYATKFDIVATGADEGSPDPNAPVADPNPHPAGPYPENPTDLPGAVVSDTEGESTPEDAEPADPANA